MFSTLSLFSIRKNSTHIFALYSTDYLINNNMKFYNAVFLLALLPSTVLGQAPGGLLSECPNGDSDCRSGLVCYTIGDPVCLHGAENTRQDCLTASDCATGFCDPSDGECARCSSASDCNGNGGIGGTIGCESGICLVGSEFIPIIWRIILCLKSLSKSCFFFPIIRFWGFLFSRH